MKSIKFVYNINLSYKELDSVKSAFRARFHQDDLPAF